MAKIHRAKTARSSYTSVERTVRWVIWAWRQEIAGFWANGEWPFEPNRDSGVGSVPDSRFQAKCVNCALVWPCNCWGSWNDSVCSKPERTESLSWRGPCIVAPSLLGCRYRRKLKQWNFYFRYSQNLQIEIVTSVGKLTSFYFSVTPVYCFGRKYPVALAEWNHGIPVSFSPHARELLPESEQISWELILCQQTASIKKFQWFTDPGVLQTRCLKILTGPLRVVERDKTDLWCTISTTYFKVWNQGILFHFGLRVSMSSSHYS